MDAEMPRSIRLPKSVWDALDKEASRCRRSATKQLEALLLTYYELEDVEIDREKLSGVRVVGELAPRSSKKTEVAETSSDGAKKRKEA